MSLKDSGGEKRLLKLGPFGSGYLGDSFDDGAHSTIKELVISYTSSDICSIQVEYDDNGNSVRSDEHGPYPARVEATYVDQITLHYPNEYLISVHGEYVKLWRCFPTHICSLTFRSNKKSYGPYGAVGVGQCFSIEAPGNTIVGFHGRASDAPDICAIGAYLKPIDLPLKEKKKTLDMNKKSCKPSKVSDVLPALGYPSGPLHQARHPSLAILSRNNDDDDQYKKQLVCTCW